MVSKTERVVSIPIEDAAEFARSYLPQIVALLVVPFVFVKLQEINPYHSIEKYVYRIWIALQIEEDIIKTIFLPLRFIFSPFDHPVWFAVALLFGVPVHELLHALAAVVFSKKGVRAVSFGFSKKAMAPYTHCKEPLKIWQYRIVLALPGVILGIIPGLVAVLISSPEWLLFSFFYLFGALGDYMMLHIMKNYPSNQLIKDHPESLGFILMD